MRVDRQTLLFSATWPAEVQALAQRHLLPDTITVEVGGALASGGKANARIEQRVSVCESDGAKLPALVKLLEELMDDGVRDAAAHRLRVHGRAPSPFPMEPLPLSLAPTDCLTRPL